MDEARPSSTTTSSTASSLVAILDAGAQYGKLIDRRVRELGVCSELVPFDTPADQLVKFAALIISGGPESVYSPTAPKFDPKLFELERPILGLCYGMQLINYHHGGTVERKEAREDGQSTIEIDVESPIFKGLASEQKVLLTHGDSLDESGVAKDFQVIARSGAIVSG